MADYILLQRTKLIVTEVFLSVDCIDRIVVYFFFEGVKLSKKSNWQRLVTQDVDEDASYWR